MMRSFKQLMAAGVAVLGLSTLPVQAATILFQDNFDTDNASPVLNFSAFNNWTISNGTVDYIRSGNFGIGCVGGAGGCVDLDGSTGNGGRMTSIASFNVLPGEQYQLSAQVSGNQRGGASDNIVLGIGGNSVSYSGISPSDPFATRLFGVIFGVPDMVQLFIDTGSGDNLGVIVDNVRFECLTCQNGNVVPEPGTLALLGLGLLGFGFARKRV